VNILFAYPATSITAVLSASYRPLLWFFQEGSGGPVRAPSGLLKIRVRGGTVSQRIAAVLLAVIALFAALVPHHAAAQTAQNDEIIRRAKTKVQPAYPELARKMQISGTVKIEVTVATNGTVKEARVVGGHPVLATAALDAAKKWRFEPAGSESSGIIDFKFEPR
jgi:TonB family protein